MCAPLAGIFWTGVIHDIDLMCWIAGERPTRVYAAGSCMVEPAIGSQGDWDTVMTTLTMPSGALVHINNCRRCVYELDQRVEAFGSKGMLQTVNHRDDNLVRWSGAQTEARQPLKHFFLESYDQSFYNALDKFHAAVMSGRPPSATQTDGRAALSIALACAQSARDGISVVPDYVD
jgi:myo-inositol 2-dehydrogenase/D-chiro-inositol 1-dehydrogenase